MLFLLLIATSAAVDSGAFSMKGRRDYQEDEYMIWEAAANSDAWLRGVYAVFDGHGGWRASHVAKQNFLSNLQARLPSVYKETAVKQALDQAIKDTEQDYVKFTHGDENPFEGTTAVVVLSIYSPDPLLLVANVGDSRAVLCQSGQAIALTRDHKPNDPKERRRIEALGGVVQQRPGDVFRVGGLAMSRAIGDTGLGNLVPADPEFTDVVLREDDFPTFLIVASDGLWDVFSAKEACYGSFGTTQIDTRLSAIAEWLAWAAYDKGSQDNISVVLARIVD